MINYVDLAINNLVIKNKILTNINEIFENGQYILGGYNYLLEEKIKKYLNVQYVLGVNSGTDALILALKSLGIGKGDEVITVSNSFFATAAAIVAVGAKPILVDIDRSRNIDISKIEESISPNVKAIIPVHLDGNPCDMGKICEIARKYNIYIVEDAAQAFGSGIGEKYVGTFGDIGCFSFHPLKTLSGAGDGGLIITDNKEIYEKILKLRNHGLTSRDDVSIWGLNSRLDELQAAILSVKIDYIDDVKMVRNNFAKTYKELLNPSYISYPEQMINSHQNYNSFVIFVKKRDKLVNYLSKHGVECKIHYPIPIHKQSPFIEEFGETILEQTELQSEEILSLPIHENHSVEDIQIVCHLINKFFESEKYE